MIKRTIEEKGYKVSAIEGFETEFERQVSYLIASVINREHEYNEGYVKWTANALLNYAKHELEKQGEPTYIPADAVLDNNKDGLIADTIRYKREKQGEQKPAEEYNITGIGSKNAQGKLGEMIKKYLLKMIN